MTNRELLIAALKDELDDPAASESIITYRIACPHCGRVVPAPCDNTSEPPWKWDRLKICGPCITEWLDAEAAE